MSDQVTGEAIAAEGDRAGERLPSARLPVTSRARP
jgi:hypothetical protein